MAIWAGGRQGRHGRWGHEARGDVGENSGGGCRITPHWAARGCRSMGVGGI